MSGAVFELGLIVVLILLNGVFSATEIALVTIRRSRIQQLIDEGHRGAVRVQRLKENPGRHPSDGAINANGRKRP